MTLDKITYNSLKYMKSGKKYILTEDLVITVESHRGNSKYVIVITLKAGFSSDGASVPLAFQWILPAWSKTNELMNVAALLHDALYGERGFNLLAREECDDLYRGALRVAGLPRYKASVVDMALYVAGWTRDHWGDLSMNRNKSSLRMTLT